MANLVTLVHTIKNAREFRGDFQSSTWRAAGCMLRFVYDRFHRNSKETRHDSFTRAGGSLLLIALLCAAPQLVRSQVTVPEDFPRFIVPGSEKEMNALRTLFWLHYQPAGPLIPLWDEWMPMSTLWPARDTNALHAMRSRWAAALASRPINSEGYVHTQQHDGPAHAEGWPFPFWNQVGGVGWHFRGTGVGGYDMPLATTNGWTVSGAEPGPIGATGWVLRITNSAATLESPRFSIAARLSPWLRLNWWAAGLDGANCYLEWTTEEDPTFGPDRRAYFTSAPGSAGTAEPDSSLAETRTMLPLYRVPSWKGVITGFRINFANRNPSGVVIKSLHTTCDTRHTINNTGFARGCVEYFLWSRDLAFLRQQVGRIRTAMQYMFTEFDTRRSKCVYTTWHGHEGRSGVRRSATGKTIVPGQGVGGNYWDLLPFGGEDALATLYYYDALLDLAELEDAIRKHPEWCVTGANAFNPADLRHHAREVREYAGNRFWNEKTGRFGTVDLDGVMHDYGFTFLNNEAIYFGLATPAQAASIRDWISGRRIVEGDTSTGADIYHWRFGPRSTTLRNLDYYVWTWSDPESIPWGYQVQDGGAVLGFSYHDLMARLQVEGPDAAWERLKAITVWFEETQAVGGYREYYKDPSRGTMQGGNVAGGLGLDKEFFESILVPQVMVYGFLGLRPTTEGLKLRPRLPKAWKELAVTRIHFQDWVLDITVHGNTVKVREIAPTGRPVPMLLPEGWKLEKSSAAVLARP